MPILAVHNVVKRYAGVTAVDGVSLDVRSGEVFALLGPNGAGKTTLLRMVLGLTKPDEGTIEFGDVGGSDRPDGGALGYLPEERGLYPDMRVRDTLVFFGALRGMRRDAAGAAADRWLERLQLGERRGDRVKELSKGNQQKIQLAAAIIHTPKLAILDEPFSGFDPVNQELCLELVRELAAAGVTVVLSAHQMQLVERIAERIVVLSNGRAVAAGTLDDIRARWQGERRITLRTASPPPAGTPGDVAGVASFAVVGTRVTAHLEADAELGPILAALATQLDIVEVHSERDSLHDLYLRAVGVRENAS